MILPKREIPLEERIQIWVAKGADPVSARWQAGLYETLRSFKDYLLPGRIVTVEAMPAEEAELFQLLVETLDLSPFVQAAYLPTALAARMEPPPGGAALRRAPAETSRMLLLKRVDSDQRLATVEISDQASPPGVDIYDQGSRLGGYDYDSPASCVREMSRMLWIHLSQRDRWGPEDVMRYNEWWLLRCALSGRPDLPHHPDYCCLRHPELLHLSRVEALFELVGRVLRRLMADSGEAASEAGGQSAAPSRAEAHLLRLMDLIRQGQYIDFTALDEDELERFKTLFAATLEKASTGD